MNRRRLLVFPSRATAVVCLCATLIAPALFAQPVAAPATSPTTVPTIPRPPVPTPATKTGGAGASQMSTVTKFVDDSVTRLANDDDADAASVSRQDLIAASVDVPGPVSVTYLQIYMGQLNKDVLPIFAKGSMRAKVNAAIVAARVGENALAANIPATALQPVASAALNDKSDAVAMWGMRATAAIMNSTPGAPDAKLLTQIPGAVQKHNLNGAITEEAYNALRDPASPKVIEALLKLYKTRIDAYAKGVPSDPSVERLASSRLTAGTGMWAKMGPAQQAQAMNLIAQALKAASDAIAPGGQAAESELRTMLIDTCKAVYVVTEKLNPALANNALSLSRQLANLKPGDIPAALQPVIAGVQAQFPQGGASGGNPVAKP